MSEFKKKVKKIVLKIKERLAPCFSMFFYYNKCIDKLPLNEKLVLLESYQGSRLTCNTLAIFEKMKADPMFKDFKFVWALLDTKNEGLLAYEGDKSVDVCNIKSKKYYKTLATAKYLINNKTFPYAFSKRDGQVYISTWHGIPLKTLGKQQFGSMGQYKNVARNIINTDFLVMPDKFTADTFLECCDATHLYEGKVIDAGYPRVDFTVNSNYEETRALLKKLVGIDTNKKIVLYAPTWRGEVGEVRDTTKVILKNLKELVKVMPEGYQILLKIHDRTYAYINESEDLKNIQNAPDWYDTSKLLSAIDILITDYSSIYFDFLNTGRPILFFTYDRKEYESTRGLYFSLDDDLPGPLCYTAQDVADAINKINQVQEEYKGKIATVKARHCYNDDGHATERVIDIIFKNKSLEYIYDIKKSKKTRLLVNTGSLVSNPLGNVLIDLINEIDLNKYEITLVYDIKSNKDDFYLKKLNPEIKIVYSIPMDGSKLRTRIIKSEYSEYEKYPNFTGEKMTDKYWKMYFEDYKFDIAVNLSPTLDFWSFLISQRSFPKKLILASASFDIEFISKCFDKMIFFDSRLYKAVSTANEALLDRMCFINLPVSFNNFLAAFKTEMVYELSKVKTYTDALNSGEKEVYFNEYVNKHKVEMGKEVDLCIEDLKKEILSNNKFKANYENNVSAFLNLLSVEKEEHKGEC